MHTNAGTLVLTGAAGFIGARFAERASDLATGLLSADYHREGNDTFTRPEHAGIDFGQLLDFEALPSWLAASEPLPSAVVHLGACSDTTETDEAFLNRVNLDYSKALWNVCADRGIPFFYASSAATYGAGELGYADDVQKMPDLAPLNLYGRSKWQFDLWALEQTKLGHAPPRWAGFKFFNVYGFGERHKGKMASVVLHGFDQIRRQGTIRLFKSHREGIADGEQKRDFVYVDDVVDVLRFAVQGKLANGIFNLGTGQARSFHDLARATFTAQGKSADIEFIDMPLELRERYQYFTEAEMDRLRAAGYVAPFTPLEEGVSKYVARLLARESGH